MSRWTFCLVMSVMGKSLALTEILEGEHSQIPEALKVTMKEQIQMILSHAHPLNSRKSA